jgi:hypothetical protein
MVKNFSDWLSESHPYYSNDHESFIERYDNAITQIEENVLSKDASLMKELHDGGFHSFVHFYDAMIDLDVASKFEDDLEKIASSNFEKIYHKGYDPGYGEPLVNDEYTRIEKEVDSQIAKPGENTKVTGRVDYNMRRRVLNNALLVNLAEKCIDEWKNVYKKWLNYVESRRGERAGKRYGV